jgi:spermidine synthase
VNDRAWVAPAVASALFFVSGFSSLVYEVVWERSLRLVFGVSTWSVALVTAGFMAGLAAGYGWGRTARLRRLSPLAVYALAETGIALYALAFPRALRLVDTVHGATGGLLPVRAALAFLVLLPPTALMGLTLPVVARAFPAATSAGRAAGTLFAANTAGAVAGTLAAAWVFLRLYGADATSRIAIGANGLAAAGGALAALAGLGVAKKGENDPSREAPATSAAPVRQAGERAVLVAALLVGVQTMGLQVAWNRTLVCVVENNTTSFASILAAVLVGSALGAALYAAGGRRRTADPSARARLFVAAEIALAVWVAASIGLLNGLYDTGRAIQAWVPFGGVAGLALVRLLVALVPVAPAAAIGAFVIPLLVDRLHARVPSSDRAKFVSRVFAADSLGSVVGALATGFVLVPLAGLAGTFVALALAGLLAAALVLACDLSARRPLVLGGLAVAAAAAGVVLLAPPLTVTHWYDGHRGIRGDLAFYREGRFGTVAVFRVGGQKDLLINCIEEVPDHRDALLLFKLLGHFPLLLHPEPRTVLVNALGAGITLGAVTLHPVQAEAVDLVPEVLEAMRLFSTENRNVAERPNWRFVHDDGRNYLRLARDRYDVITADATHPAAGESWPLYTREYYRIVGSRLGPDGIFAQWLPLHNMAEGDFLAALRTFRESFADMAVLFVQRYSILVGSLSRLRLDPQGLTQRIAEHPEVAEDLASLGIRDGRGLLRYLVLDAAGVERLAAGAELVTDDRAPVEFAELHRLGIPETFHGDLALLAAALDPQALAARTGLDPGTFRARRMLLRAMLRSREPTLPSAYGACRELEQARAESPDDPDVEAVLATVQEALVRYLGREYRELLAQPDRSRLLEIAAYARAARPEDPFLNQFLGAVLIGLGRFAEAVPYLERAAAARPDDWNYQSNLVYAYEQSGRLADALRALDRLEGLAPGRPELAAVRRRIEQRLEGERRKTP